MKLYKLILLLFTINTFIFAGSKTIPKGWSLHGVGINEASIDPSSFEDGIVSIWSYKAGDGWSAYSSADTISEQLTKAGIKKLELLESGKGFWINSTKELTYSSFDSSKMVSDSFESTTDSDFDNLTYNYTTGAGVIQNDIITWKKGVTLSDGVTIGNSKVFSSVDKEIELIINSYECTSDLTLAITPYSSINTIPGIVEFFANDTTAIESSSFASKTTSDGFITLSLNSYEKSGVVIEPLVSFSADIATKNGDIRLSPLEVENYCSSFDIDLKFLDSFTYDKNTSYKLNYINGYDYIKTVDINMTDNNGTLMVENSLPSLKPFFITKQTLSDTLKDSELTVSVNAEVIGSEGFFNLFSSTISGAISVDDMVITSTDNNTTILTYPNISQISNDIDSSFTYSFALELKANSDAISQFISSEFNEDGYRLYGYDESITTWKQISTSTLTGKFSKFVIVKEEV